MTYRTYLKKSRHGTTYTFRRRVPAALQEVIGLKSINRALPKSEKRVVTILARQLAVLTDQLFAQVTRMLKTDEDGSKNTADFYQFQWALESHPDGRFTLNSDGSHEDNEGALKVAQWLIETRSPRSSAQDDPIRPANPPGLLTIADAAQMFLDKTRSSKSDSTLKAYSTALNTHAIPFFGRLKPIQSIGQKDIAAYAEHLNQLARSSSTIEGYATALTAMGAHHRDRGESVPTWSLGNLLRRDAKTAKEKRAAYNLEEMLAVLSNAASYLEREPGKFWVTALAMFTGARIEEICQLNLHTDLKQEGEVWYLDINDKTDPNGASNKRLKNKSSARLVPVHSALIETGLINYLKGLSSSKSQRPFEMTWLPLVGNRDHPKWSHKIAKWGGRELRKLDHLNKIEKGTLSYFHSFRHSFDTHLDRQGVPEHRRALLTGHTTGGISSSTYSKVSHDIPLLSALIEDNFEAYVTILKETRTGQ